MLPIGIFSKFGNITAKTLRYYDEIGLLKPVYINSENGYRYYNAGQLVTVLLIKKLKLYGFSLEEMSEILKNPDDDVLFLFYMKKKQEDMQKKVKDYEYILSSLDKDIINLEKGVNIMAYLDDIQVKLTETQPKNILFLRQKMNVSDYGIYLGKLYEIIMKDKYKTVGAPLSIYHDKEFDPENYDIEIAVPVEEKTEKTRELSGGLCATVLYKGPYSGLTSVYTKLNQWIESEGYKIINAPYEIYLTNPGTTAPENYMTEIYFPVEKK